jgi:hypothetical protein
VATKIKGPTKVVHRSSVTGRMVTEKYADAHPRTTETQHVHVKPPKKTGK